MLQKLKNPHLYTKICFVAKKKKNDTGFIVYSTNPDFKPNDLSSLFGGFASDPEVEQPKKVTLSQQVRIWKERVKGGKEATVIKGLEMDEDPLTEMARTLKSKCAAGGAAKDGEIIIQGDHRDKVLKYLIELGYKNTKKAGG
jgi:translation initiation factor 1